MRCRRGAVGAITSRGPGPVERVTAPLGLVADRAHFDRRPVRGVRRQGMKLLGTRPPPVVFGFRGLGQKALSLHRRHSTCVC